MISLIIPLFNEEENLKLYPEELFPVVNNISKKYNIKFEYVFIDDGSSDNTLREIKNLTQDLKFYKIIHHDKNQGMGAAIKTGIKNSSGDCIICMDADLTFRPENIENLLIEFFKTNADCVSGSPYLEKDDLVDVDSYRLFLSKSINLLYRILLRKKITSISPIFRLYKMSALKDLNIVSNNFEINAEILSKLIINGKTIVEVPVPLYKRRYGYSKINVKKEIINNLKLIAKIIKVKYFRTAWD